MACVFLDSCYPEEPMPSSGVLEEQEAMSGQLDDQTSSQYASLLIENAAYAAAYDPAESASIPGPVKQIAVLTCMDHRMDIYKILGLQPGDVQIIRNAGAMATDDAIRSLAIAHKLSDVQSIFVIKHTGCAMLNFENDHLDDLMTESMSTADLKTGETKPDYTNMDYHPKQYVNRFKIPNPRYRLRGNEWLAMDKGLIQNVTDHVKILRRSDAIPTYTPIYGFYYDLASGKLVKVEEAFKAGRSIPVKR